MQISSILNQCETLYPRGVGGGGGGGGRRYFLGPPKLLRGPMTLLFHLYGLHLHTVFLYLLLSRHCLNSVSECLGRIISNAFIISVDKLFDVCKHVEPTLLTMLHE